MHSNTIDLREYESYGHLMVDIAHAGIYSFSGSVISYSRWYFATYTRDTIGMIGNTVYLEEWGSYGLLIYGVGFSGLSSLTGSNHLGALGWTIAT